MNREKNQVWIGEHAVGKGRPCFVIAEAGSNHDRDLGQARSLVDAAVAAGTDAVKFQTFTAEKIAARTSADIARIDFGGAKSLYELYQRTELPWEWHQDLFAYCNERGIMFLSSPFDEDASDKLEELGVDAYKIASFELVHLPLLRHVARKNKPVILSTGMASLGEIEDAVNAIYGEGNDQVILLHCGINYPVDFGSVNLAAMDTLRQAFQMPVGYSDHTLGLTVPIAAVARGANVIEKHFTIDKALAGPDHSFALDPSELGAMVRGIRNTEAAMGSPRKRVADDETEHLERGRRSLFARVDLPSGTTITEEKLAVLRPGIGISPRYLDLVLGRKTRKRIAKHEPITWDSI